MIWALLPLKDFVNAKTRLSGVLSAAERRSFFHTMVEDVLDVLAAHPAIVQTVIVSDDPSASLLAEHYGIECWSESRLQSPGQKLVSGLTAVVDGAAQQLAHSGVETLLVVHGDLPLITAAEITQLVTSHEQKLQELQGEPTVSIVPDTISDGSNCMVCTPPNVIAFQYGQASFQKHQREASKRGVAVNVVNLAGLACDIDNPQDISLLLGKAPRNQCKSLAYLQESGIAERVTLMMKNAEVEKSKVL